MVKNSYIFLITLITLLFCIGCAHTRKNQYNPKCIPIFNQILYLQDSQELSLLQLEISAEQYESGAIRIKEYRYREERWVAEETELKTEVNKLTKKAKRLNCL